MTSALHRSAMPRFNTAFTTGLLLLALLLSGSACVSPVRHQARGNFDRAIQEAVKRLRRNRTNDKHIAVLENSFAKAQEIDLAQVNYLLRDGQPENWERVYYYYGRIRNRQGLVRQVLPLTYRNGRIATFTMQDVDDRQLEAKQKAAEFLYASALQLLQAAERNGDRFAAREAYVKLDEISKYYTTYRDRASLMSKARQLGITRVFFKMVNTAPIIMPRQFEQNLLRMVVADLNGGWVQYETTPTAGTYHYDILMDIQRIQISPERVQERTYTDVKKVQDGTENVIVTDSLGRSTTVRQPRMITVSAIVQEVYQTKGAVIAGILTITDNTSRQTLRAVPVTSEAVFENYAATYRGDRRALSEESQRKMGNQPLPFPSDEQILLNSSESMKNTVKKAILDNATLIR